MFSKMNYYILSYSLLTKEGKVMQVRITPVSDRMIKVRGIDKKYTEILTIDEFFIAVEGKPSIFSDAIFFEPKFPLLIVFMLCMLLLCLLFLCLRVYFYSKGKRKLRKIKGIVSFGETLENSL